MNADEILLFIYCDGSLLMIGLKKKNAPEIWSRTEILESIWQI